MDSLIKYAFGLYVCFKLEVSNLSLKSTTKNLILMRSSLVVNKTKITGEYSSYSRALYVEVTFT